MTDPTFDHDNATDDATDSATDDATSFLNPVPAYAELARIVLGDQSLSAVLARIAELAAQVIPGADEVSITLIEHGKARSVVFTGDLAADLDERQYEDGFGPCMDAAMTGRVITVEDTAHTATYPDFGHQAHRHGISHTLSVGMSSAEGPTGAMNIYGAGPVGPFPEAAHEIATTFTGYAAVALLNASTHAAALDEVAQLRQAMASRAGIEQAKGILMRDRHCTADEAFTILKDLSSRSHLKLRDVAQAVLNDAT
jgi:GAF domain-containing protein